MPRNTGHGSRGLADSGSGSLDGELPAVGQIAHFMGGDEFDHAGPQPRRRLERARPVSTQLAAPPASRRSVHLATMSAPHDAAEIARNQPGLALSQPVEIELEILWKQLAHEYVAVQELCGQHALAQMWRQLSGASTTRSAWPFGICASA